jgi:hypothetical protein
MKMTMGRVPLVKHNQYKEIGFMGRKNKIWASVCAFIAAGCSAFGAAQLNATPPSITYPILSFYYRRSQA